MITERNNRRDVLYIRVGKGTEIITHHYLVVGKLRMPVKEETKSRGKKKLYVESRVILER